MNGLRTKCGGGVPLNARPLICAGKRVNITVLFPALCQGVRG